jgi:NAD(P)-dependent dehydrogenase (short-subunit alcohol dehydrogenase family)
VRRRIEEEDGLHLLVNNAGASWPAAFGDAERGGYANVRRTMELNFDAQVRLTEALVPLLRRSAPSSIVNVSSTAGRVGLPRQGAYAASKFALAGWTETLQLEERRHGVHVGLVLPASWPPRASRRSRCAATDSRAGSFRRRSGSPRRSSTRAPAGGRSGTSRARTGWPRRPASLPGRRGAGWPPALLASSRARR